MNIASNPLVKIELESLQLQFPNKSHLTLDDYSALYKTNRRDASRHLKRRGIPSTKEGKAIYISVIDLAVYKAQHKALQEKKLLLTPIDDDEMKNRRGFNKMAQEKLGQKKRGSK